MSDYFQYLKEFLIAFFTNIGHWFNHRFPGPWARVPGEFEDYSSLL